MLDESSWALLKRLTRWLDKFKICFGHRAQQVSLEQYVEGLLGDSARKSMQSMLARVTEPVSYQTFQHFITDAPWDASVVWRRLLEVLPERRGILILDDTGFPKQGRQSVGVGRQYSGTLGKIGNCQVAVTGALWNGRRAWLVGSELYLPKDWLTEERRAKARIPRRVQFREKWRQALSLLRRVLAAGLHLEAVVADAGYGDSTGFRKALERLKLPYAVGVSSTVTVFRGHPCTRNPPPQPKGGRPRKRPLLDGRVRSISAANLAKQLPQTAWRSVSWRNDEHAQAWKADFAAIRVTPAHDWRSGRLAKEVWLLCERLMGKKAPSKYYLIDLPPRTRLSRLVRLAHHRWAIEQQYQQLKVELGLDHFEGRTYPGWNHHMVLCAITYAFLQKERMRKRSGPLLTLPESHAIVQEIFIGLLFASRPSYVRWLNRAQRNFPLRM